MSCYFEQDGNTKGAQKNEKAIVAIAICVNHSDMLYNSGKCSGNFGQRLLRWRR